MAEPYNPSDLKKLLDKKLHKDYFHLKGKKAEKIVHDLAIKTFLTDWCYLNPKWPDGKELCDLLVFFDDIAIIWQIKDLKLDKQGRYNKSEVQKNLSQLSGAQRKLFDLKAPIELENPRRGREVFDSKQIKEIYLISVLFGEGEEYYSGLKDYKNHTVHVLTREFTEIVLNELDTISDFIDYLRKKEVLFHKIKRMTILGGEEELLAGYLMNNRSFKKLEEANMILIDQGSWKRLLSKPEYKLKKKEDERSYIWDTIINTAHRSGIKKYEEIARELAHPNRFYRRVLSKGFFNALKLAQSNKQDIFRRVFEIEGTTYCYLFQDTPEPRTVRQDMLGMMCLIARGIYQKNKKVIGIATEKKLKAEGFFDLCLLDLPELTPEIQQRIEELKKETGILVNLKSEHFREDEYPQL